MHVLHNPKTNTFWLVVSSGDRMRLTTRDATLLCNAGLPVEHTNETIPVCDSDDVTECQQCEHCPLDA